MSKHFLNKIFFIALCALNITPSIHTTFSDYRAVRYGAKAARITWHTAQTTAGVFLMYHLSRKLFPGPIKHLFELQKKFLEFLQNSALNVDLGIAKVDSCINALIIDIAMNEPIYPPGALIIGALGLTTLHTGLKGLYKELEIEAALKIARKNIQNVRS